MLLVEFIYFSYLLACQVGVTVGNSGLSFCVLVTSFGCYCLLSFRVRIVRKYM